MFCKTERKMGVLTCLLVVAGLVSVAIAGEKVDVCHNDWDSGEYFVIRISSSAVDAHLENHGDWLVSEELCDDEIDNDCDGEVNEGCDDLSSASCPCLESLVFEDLVTNATDGSGEMYCDLYSLDTWGVEGMGIWSQGGPTGSWYADASSIDWLDGSYSCFLDYNDGLSSGSVEDLPISMEEYEACQALLTAVADSLGVDCQEFEPWW